jgi:LPXTG-motif cell wall-anchored protein
VNLKHTLIAGAAVTVVSLAATHGVASAHVAAAVCIEGTDTYEVVALTSEPGFTWTGDDVSWTATWADGVTDEGPAPEACTTPSSTTTTTTTSPVTTSPAEPTTTAPAQSTSTAPVTTAPPDTSTPPAGPGVPPTSAASGRTELPATGVSATQWTLIGALLCVLGFIGWAATRKPDDA